MLQLLPYTCLLVFVTICSFYPNTNQCKAMNRTSQGCIAGYFGSDCNLICRYPSYGEGCQMHCGCKQDRCNHVSGCTMSQRCPTGYTGHDCKKPCPYPSFGIDCQLRCCCAQNRCNHMFGCNTSYINGYEDDCRMICNDTQNSLWGCNFDSNRTYNDIISKNEEGLNLVSVNLTNPYVFSIIFIACFAFVLSVTYACTFRKACNKKNIDQSRYNDMSINGEPIYDVISRLS